MTNRSSILPPYNLSDTSSSLSSPSSSSSLATPHDLYWSASSSSSSRRIMPSPPSSCSPFTSTATTTSSSSSSCHCLRIDSLRHDPVHFIPAYFAELNLPPPASIWTTTATASSTTSLLHAIDHDPTITAINATRGFAMGREHMHEANSSVLWFMYHDALAVRFPPFIFIIFLWDKHATMSHESPNLMIFVFFPGESSSR